MVYRVLENCLDFWYHLLTRKLNGLIVLYQIFQINVFWLISSKNTDLMIHMGLSLLIVALESGVDHIASYVSLLFYVKDDLCKNLFTVSIN